MPTMTTYFENNDTPSGIAKSWLRRERLVPENPFRSPRGMDCANGIMDHS